MVFTWDVRERTHERPGNYESKVNDLTGVGEPQVNCQRRLGVVPAQRRCASWRSWAQRYSNS
jgi:hypothetical protein